MRRFVWAALVVAAINVVPLVALGQAQSSPAPTVTIAPAAEDPTVTKMAIAEFAAFQAGKVDPSRYAQTLPDSAVAQVHAGLSTLGTVQNVVYLGKKTVQGIPLDQYKFICSSGAAVESIYVQNGKIAAIFFAPAQ